jgi:hypothetical protein
VKECIFLYFVEHHMRKKLPEIGFRSKTGSSKNIGGIFFLESFFSTYIRNQMERLFLELVKRSSKFSHRETPNFR